MRGHRPGPQPAFAAHDNHQAKKSKAWPISSHLQAWRWDAAHISPDRNWLQEASDMPVWPADKGDASQTAASTIPGTHSHQACLVRPLPKSQQTSTCQAASLAQQQVFLPLRSIEASKFLPTNRAAPLPHPEQGHQATEGSQKPCPALWVSSVGPAATQKERKGRAGSATGDPTGAWHQPALFKRTKSQQAVCVPNPNEKSKAFRNGFNYLEAAKQGSLP